MKKQLLLFSFIFALGCAPKKVVLTRSQLLMGHVPVNISVKIPPQERLAALKATDAAYGLAQGLEKQLSEWQSESDISCLNRHAGRKTCQVASQTLELLQAAMALSKQTDAAFDIRFPSLSEAGRHGEIKIYRATSEAMLSHPETRLGVSSIAKGYIVDKMVALLRERGFNEVIVNAGGDTFAAGGPWLVGFQEPSSESFHFTLMQKFRDKALGSSGLYEQGKHIIDPRNGEKVDRPGGITVVADNLAFASGLATGLFVLGEKLSESYLAKFPGIAVYWIDPNGGYRVYGDPSFSSTVTPQNASQDGK